MQPNVIYLSDASYDPITGSTGIGVKNLSTSETLSLSLYADGVKSAEEYALICAIEHALIHGHRNCVFVYDNMGIDTRSLHAFYEGMFEKLQFMWFKRDYLEVVDRLASMARQKKEKHPRLGLLLKHLPSLSESELIAMFMPLARGETYGFLSAISQTAPFYRDLPKGMGSANRMVISMLYHLGGKELRKRLGERFGERPQLKNAAMESFLAHVMFDLGWIHDARNECRGLKSA